MKKIITLLLISLALSGCGPSRRGVRSGVGETYSAVETTVTSEARAAASHYSATTRLDREETSVTVTEEFDTSRPVDPLTGTPPLVRRIVSSTRAVESGAKEETEESVTGSEQTTRTVSTRDSETVAFSEEETRRGPGRFRSFFTTAGILLTIGCAIWFTGRLISKKYFKL